MATLKSRMWNVLSDRTQRKVRRRLGIVGPWDVKFKKHPPKYARDEVVGPPDFVGIGAQKAGTSRWYYLIASHPDVWKIPNIHKERHFFAHYGAQSFDDQAIEEYARWFPRPPKMIVGEWTPDYLYQPWVAPLLRRAAPNAKLLVTLRDPLDRFESGLRHLMNLEPRHYGATVAQAMYMSRYADGLRRWIDVFGRDRLLVLQYEKCVIDPKTELAKTYAFLGLDDSYVPDTLEDRRNPSRGNLLRLDGEARERTIELLRQDAEEVAAMLPELDFGLWKNFK